MKNKLAINPSAHKSLLEMQVEQYKQDNKKLQERLNWHVEVLEDARDHVLYAANSTDFPTAVLAQGWLVELEKGSTK